MSYYDSEDQGNEYDDIDWLNPNPQRFWFLDNLLFNKKRKRNKNLANRVTVFVPGTIYWAKVLGEPRPNYEGTAREWTYDLMPDDTTFLKEHKLLDRLKEKEPIPGPFIRLKKPEFTAAGEKNDHIRIYDSENEPWDDRLLGNGTKVVAKLQIADWGAGKKKSIYTQALRVEELVSFVSNEFGAFDDAAGVVKTPKKKAAAKATTGAGFELDDLDDDVPSFDE